MATDIIDGASEHRLGMLLVTLSAAVFGLSGILTKSIDADPLTITSWRGLAGGLLITAYVLWRRRDGHGESLDLGWQGWMLAIVGTFASIAFIAAFKNTYVANVVVIYATVPFVVALLAWVIIGEVFRRQTAVAAAVCLVGVAVMVWSGLGGGHAFGDMLALLMTFTFALYATLVRRFRNASVVWAGAVSAFLGIFPAWFVTDPLAVPSQDIAVLAIFGLTFALAVVLWTEGARRIPAAEAGLLGTAEVPFGIFFAWLFLAELPPVASLAGGAIVLAAVFWHAWRDWAGSRAVATALANGEKESQKT
ncbi:drug/metabolite transporter (DMT)-like permease [Aminobacter niigataensis]|uniref:Drug/metabolite transporter (DMT)-like permease n=1 Tax=Aminobacter niigataensis TaxID=83265 RepID=A0ABR6L023_9HYPH|nr:DMT family transporter [Aminobacter niigataensis]MBB4650148.1 drug/metabolite transporter (DMT)-like permease [Aminobacter niigataensis]